MMRREATRWTLTVKSFAFVGIVIILAALYLLAPVARAADLGLIDAASLHRNPSAWTVLDARPKREWEAGHIPKSRSFSWEDYTRTDGKGIRYRPFPPKELAAALARLGIDERTPVAVYGDADRSWGGEGWDIWVLSWLGHKGPIRLLQGGVQAWRSENLPLVRGAENGPVAKPRYVVNLKPEIEISTEEIECDKGSPIIIDVRSTLERLEGRIPRSVHIPWSDFYKGSDRRPLASSEVAGLLKDRGVDVTRPVVYYCLGGIRSSYAWLVHELAGLPHARNYLGGMEAWEKRPSR
jgi:thiosulfate/3-mercaptopyruvate sulfurtransferase